MDGLWTAALSHRRPLRASSRARLVPSRFVAIELKGAKALRRRPHPRARRPSSYRWRIPARLCGATRNLVRTSGRGAASARASDQMPASSFRSCARPSGSIPHRPVRYPPVTYDVVAEHQTGGKRQQLRGLGQLLPGTGASIATGGTHKIASRIGKELNQI